ncbi:hypothetical protein IFM89_003161 [Coptis chinensis]|uniref:HECT-type E3 ubiquitin transferase n=1 Tax=Coptis chinensis TaxID=261450 RepID=A0A835M6N9_9MAGN|nr:hypothetical protein IFM89_003161 [Coptis chinensis]
MVSVLDRGYIRLCDDLSLRPEGSLSRTTSESLAPPLVVLARQESSHSPDVMLFAIRAITYLCEAHPRSSRFLVENDVVSVLCAPLMAIEYLDVAEECIQALEKISLDHSLECLQAGVIGYILNFLDFFSSCVQRSGISTIENICLVDDFPSDCWTQVREAVPVLCNLLNYEDQKLVEHAASSLMRIVSNVRKSSEMVDEICKHGLIHQVVRFIASSSGTKTILSQSMYTDLIWLLSQLVCSGSITASNTLFELNVSCALKDILCSYEQSQNKQPYSQMIHEVIDLLNVLLPPVSNEGEDDKEISESKERIIAHQPGLLRQFGADVLPVLVQLVNSCADLDVCYGCLSVIDKIVVHFSRSVVLVDLLKGTPLASFLAGIISWNKDPHFLMLALRIVETVIQKLPAVFLDSFMKEGIVYAINALVTPMQTSNGKMAENDENTCLCYTYSRNNQTSPSDGETCMLEENSVPTLAKHITDKYFNTATQCSEFGLTKVLQKLRNLCAILSDMVNLSTKNNSCEEESLTLILGQIMEELNGEEPLSNFEFIQSGLVTSLVDYLSNGCYRTKKVDPCDLPSHLDVVQKRFEVFSRFCLSSTSHHQKDMPLAILMEKLQRAASSLETFPVISHAFEPEENYATIPSGRPTTHPCLEVCFTKVEGEAALCDYSSDAVHVEAFTSIEAIERYMWPEVSTSRSKHDEELATESKEQPESSAPEVSVSASTSGLECSLGEHLTPSIESDIQQLIFYLDGEQLDRSLTLYQAVLQLEMKKENDLVDGPSFWDRQYKIAYGKATEQKEIHIPMDHPRNNLCISSMLFGEPPSSFEKSSPIYEILILLKILEVVNKAASHVASHERSNASADGQNNSLDNMLVTGCRVPQTEFVSIKLTEKLEQQMQESLIVSAGSMPSWWMQLMEAFPFLFSFEARSKYFQRTSHGSFEVQAHSEDNSNGRQLHISGLARKKFKVCRSRILESAAEIMSSRKCHEAILEVEYSEEVGTGLGPTMEFFTLVSQEFQKVGLGMWREDHGLLTSGDSLEVENSGFVMAPWGLFLAVVSCIESTSKRDTVF